MRPRVVFISVILLASTILVTCGNDHGRSAAVPAILTVGQPQSDTVVRLGFNDYAAAVTPGALYKISITSPTDDTDLLVFGADSTYSVLAQCSINNTSIIGTSPEDCIMAAPSSTLYFSVDGTFLTAGAASYVIDIELLPGTNLVLQTPLSDSTSQRSAVVYTVPVSPGVAYTIGMTGLSDDADLSVFGNDGTFTALAACSIDNTRFIGTTPEDCTWTSSAGTLYFIVDGIFSSAAVVQYTVLAMPAPVVPIPTNEGTPGSPVPLFLNTPITGQVAYGGTSFYAVSGLTIGTRYTVSILGLTGNANLTVTTPASCLVDNTNFTVTTPEDCTLVASGSTLYFTVATNTSGGVAYINLIEPGP